MIKMFIAINVACFSMFWLGYVFGVRQERQRRLFKIRKNMCDDHEFVGRYPCPVCKSLFGDGEDHVCRA